MKSNLIKTLTLAAIAGFLLTVSIGPEVDAATAAGKITRLRGHVTVYRGGKKIRARIGTRIMPGDSVQTKRGSKVKVLTSDSTVVSLGSRSRMRIKRYRRNPRTRRTTANYSLIHGRARARVPKRRGSSRSIRFSTPTAVAGVRGTELIFEYDATTGQTRIVAVGGSVNVINPDMPGEPVTLTAGMGTTVGAGSVPTSPFQMSAQQIAQLRRQAQVPGSSPRRVVVVDVPGTSGSDISGPGDTGPGGGPIIDDGGAPTNPGDLLDQEPPPLTPVIINLRVAP